MLKTYKIAIGDTEYTMCLTARAIANITQKYGGLKNISANMQNIDDLGDLVFFIWALIDAGARYERLNGREAPDTPSYDDLLDLLGLDDFSRLTDAVTATFTNGKAQEVKAIPPKKGKNAKATQGA